MKVNKIFTSEIKQIGVEEDRVLRFITSTEAVDRDGDIISVDGWKLDNYMKNPVILYGHNYEGLPVGKSINIQKDNINKTLIQDVKFPTKEEYEFADTVYRLAKSGYLNATSVGFIGLESEPRLNEKGEYLGKMYKKQELLETSIVPVPSNPTALMEARSKGIINDNELKMFEEAKEVIIKPGWDETETSFRFRVRDPGLFQDGSFRTVPIKKDKPRVNSVMGRLKGEESLTVQSVIFPKEDDWDLADAKAWIKEHEDLAKGGEKMEQTELKDYSDIELKSMVPIESKKPDLQGNPSVFDIMDAIRLSINPSGIYIGGGPYIEDLYPIRYPSGSVILEKMEKCFLYQYEYKEGKATLSADFIELEELYKPKGYYKKTGATLSNSTKKMLDEIHSDFTACGDRLRKFIDSSGMMEPPDMSATRTADLSELSMKIEMSEELKQTLEEIKSQVFLLSQKDAPKVFDLDAIEFPTNQKDAAQDELDIKPEELKTLIKEIIENQLKEVI